MKASWKYSLHIVLAVTLVFLVLGEFNDAFALQYGRPNSDVSKGLWTDTSGGNNNAILYDETNESIQNNANYANSRNLGSGATSDIWIAGLSGVNDPLVSNNHQVKYAYQKNTGAGSTLRLVVTLLQGTTTIASWTHSSVASGWVLRTQTLSAAQTNAITDYSNLQLQFTATCTTCTANLRNIQVSWADFEIPNAVPGVPTGLTATVVSSSQIDLSWTAPSSNGGSPITGYKIERESPIGGGWSTLVANTGSTGTTYSNTGLNPNTQYNYRVSAINAVGTGGPSNTANATTNSLATIPAQVTGLALTPSQTQIILDWVAPYDGGSAITGYKIEFESPAGGGWSALILDTGSTSTTFTDDGLTPSTQYNYRVYAINGVGVGPASDPANTYTLAAATIPSRPLNLIGSFDGTNYVLSWDVPSSDGGSAITDYIIEYSPDASSWNTYDDGVSTDTSATISSLSHQDYSFRVSAKNAIGTGLPSSVVAISLAGQDTSETTQRNPPKILGLGVYHFEFPESFAHSHGINETSRFENYYPYAINTYTTDHELYQSLGNYEKTGEFFKIDDDQASALSQIHTEPNDSLQFQVQILDEYRGSKIEHVALYFVEPKSNEIKSDTEIIWERPDAVKILDPGNIIDSVHVTPSMEDGYLWAVFDVKIREGIDSDIGVEIWHESKVPTFAKVTNLFHKLTPAEFIERKTIIDHVARITIPNEQASSPDCKDTKTCFIPYSTYILNGGMVIWANEDEDFIHSIASGTPETGPDNRFNGLVHPGEIFHHNFDTVGIYPYYCMIHPWAEGIVTVIEEKTAVTIDQTHTPGVNVAGDVVILKKNEFPLVLETDSSGKSFLIKQNDKIVLETKNLDVKLSGYVGTRNPIGQVEINILRPDGSATKYTIPVNEDGKYYLPTKLGNRWQTGTFQVIAKYDGKQLGNISFIVTDKQKGFGGILQTSANDSILSQLESGSVDRDSLSGMGWMSVETQDPVNHRLYLLTKITSNDASPTDTNSIKFEYYYLLGVIPLIVSILLFRNNAKN